MTVTIHWPDGKESTAESFDVLFTQLHKEQWESMTADEFKQELARRTEVWTGKRIGFAGTPEDLFRMMADVEAIQIVEEPDHICDWECGETQYCPYDEKEE